MFLGRIIEHLLIKSPAEMSALTLGAFKIQKYYSNWNYLMEFKIFSQYIFYRIIQTDNPKILLIITCQRKLKSAGVLFERFFSLIAVGKFQLGKSEVGKHRMKSWKHQYEGKYEIEMCQVRKFPVGKF